MNERQENLSRQRRNESACREEKIGQITLVAEREKCSGETKEEEREGASCGMK